MWETGENEDGVTYYFNTETEQSVWDHPMDEHYRNLFQDEKNKYDAGLFVHSSNLQCVCVCPHAFYNYYRGYELRQ